MHHVCEESCHRAPAIADAESSEHCIGTESRKSCNFSCHRHFPPSGPVVCSDGTWGQARCHTKCFGPTKIPNVDRDSACQDTVQGQPCTFTCQTGYTPSGPAVCEEGAVVNGTCDGDPCGSRPLIQHIDPNSTCKNVSSGATCKLSCLEGFISPGPATCLAGAWEVAVCDEAVTATAVFYDIAFSKCCSSARNKTAFLEACTTMLGNESLPVKCSRATIGSRESLIVTFTGTAASIETLLGKERENFPATEGQLSSISVAAVNGSVAENSYPAENGGKILDPGVLAFDASTQIKYLIETRTSAARSAPCVHAGYTLA